MVWEHPQHRFKGVKGPNGTWAGGLGRHLPDRKENENLGGRGGNSMGKRRGEKGHTRLVSWQCSATQPGGPRGTLGGQMQRQGLGCERP